MKARIPGAPQGGQAAMLQRLQDMQAEMQRTQEEVEATDYVASAGGGAVEVTVSGKKEVLSVKLSPDVVDPDDIEMLQDLIVAATNEALRQAEADSDAMMAKMTGGMGGFPF